MKRNYAIIKRGKLVRKNNSVSFMSSLCDFDQNTLLYDTDNYFTFGERKDIPVNDIDSINIFADVLITKKFLEFVSSRGINLNIYGFYGDFAGTFYSPFNKFDGSTLINQVNAISNQNLKLYLSKSIIAAGITNLYRNIQYYKNRDRNFDKINFKFDETIDAINNAPDTNIIMLIEAGFRKKYYKAFDKIITNGFVLGKRSFYPPNNPINAMISFLNSMVYSVVMNQLTKTNLHPGLSFIHSAGANRLSLVWDIAEIFKPVVADRILFGLCNRNRINKTHFNYFKSSCYLNNEGKRIVLEKFNEKITEPNKYLYDRNNISMLSIIKEECYKLQNTLNNGETYHPYIARW